MITGPRSGGELTGLPALLGVNFTSVSADRVEATLDVTDAHLAPIGYLHAGTVVTLADTACGYGCLAALPVTAIGFTTVELKCNHLATAAPGQQLVCTAIPVHRGRSTQVWDAVVTIADEPKPIATFRCTQLVLYPPATV